MKTEGGVPNVALPAVPLPESVARSLSSTGVPFSVPSPQLQPPGSVGQLVPVTSGVSVGAPASTPTKPLFRPFGLSPPPPPSPSSKTPVTSASPTVSSVAPQISLAPPPLPPGQQGATQGPQHHPAYRPFDAPNFFPPGSTAGPGPIGGYNPYKYQPVSSAAPSNTPYNSLFPPPRTTTPASTLVTHTVAASHHDLTCKSHLPKLAHALTNTAPKVTPSASSLPPPPSSHQQHHQNHQQQKQAQLPPPGGVIGQQPKSSYPSLPLNDPANLRRELDNRYLHDRNLAGALRPPQFMGSDQITNPLASSLAPPLQRPPGNQSPLFLTGPLVSEWNILTTYISM